MRISATVEVSNRSVPSLNISKRRPEKSYLTIGFVSNRKDKIFILHQTLTNSAGVKYKVSDNVSSILERFSNEGKFTIRFTEPTVDLIVKGEPQSVKKFLNILKCSLNLKVTKVPNLSNLMAAPTKVISEPTTKLIIKKKVKLPDLPRSLRHLEISDCTLTKFPFGVLRLQYMRVLNLNNNDIEEIPNQIELLPCLEELYMENNKLGARSKFSWLKCDSLCERLTVLDLRKNEITFFPKELLYLKSIRGLFLDHNKLKELPPALWKLHSSLRTFTISHNKITILPGSIIRLRLLYFDLSENPFSSLAVKKPLTKEELRTRESMKVPSLLAIAGTTVLQKRIMYDEEMLPRTVIDFLDNAGYCICGRPSFGGFGFTCPLSSNLLRRICQEYNVSMSSPEPTISFDFCCLSGCDKNNPFFLII